MPLARSLLALAFASAAALAACFIAEPTPWQECANGKLCPLDTACSPDGERCLACGNGIQDPGESCDDGNRIDGDGCDHDCTATTCGNGIRTTGEDCDDGNRIDGDECRNDCRKACPGRCCGDDGRDFTEGAPAPRDGDPACGG